MQFHGLPLALQTSFVYHLTRQSALVVICAYSS